MKRTKIIIYKKTISLLIIITFVLFYMNSCKDKRNPIPSVSVNITIDLYSPSFTDFSPGTFKNIIGGLSGIIVYRRSFDEFTAIERTCPYESKTWTRVTAKLNDYAVECDSCHSRFSIDDGTLINGPSEFPLRTYQTSYDGDRYLRIYN